MTSAATADELLDRAIAHFEHGAMGATPFDELGAAVGVDQPEFEVHFPTRNALDDALMRRIYALEKDAEEFTATGATDLDAYLAGIVAAFEWNLDPRHRALRRLEFEIAGGSRDSVSVRRFYDRWLTLATTDLVTLGLTPEDAAIEARILNNAFNGFLYDIVVNADVEIAREAFGVALGRYRARLSYLIELT